MLLGWEELGGIVDEFAQFLLPAASALAVVGLLASALIELLKQGLSLRRWHHRSWMRARCGERREALRDLAEELRKRRKEAQGSEQGDASELYDKADNLVRDACGPEAIEREAAAGDWRALYALPPERMIGQLDAAFQLSLMQPVANFDIFWLAAKGADVKDVADLLLADLDARSDRRGVEEISPRGEKIGDVRARVGARAQRQFDAWKVSLDYEWRRWMHIASVGLSAGIILAAGVWRTVFLNDVLDPVDLVFYAIVAFLGGVFAPVARDFVVNLKSLGARDR